MSTDFENELRDLFREKAEEAPLATPTLPATPPRQVLRRGRRRQVGTVLGSAVVIVALIVGSVAGLTQHPRRGQRRRGRERRLRRLPANGDGRGVHRGEPFGLVPREPVAAVDAHPCRGEWRVVLGLHRRSRRRESRSVRTHPATRRRSSPIPTPHGLPMLQLSNIDLGLARERVRRRGSRGRRRPLRGARLQRCDRRHRGSVDPGIPTRRRPPAGGRRPVRSRSIRALHGQRRAILLLDRGRLRRERRRPGNGRDLLRDDVGDPRLDAHPAG